MHGFLQGDDLTHQFTESSATAYDCKICGQSLKHEYTSIDNHMRLTHKITLAKYGLEHETKVDSQIPLKRKSRALNSFVKIKKLKVEDANEDTKEDTNTKEDIFVREGIEFSDSSGDEEEN